jgi:hypothetical protein
MLVADTIHLSREGEQLLAIVTSDDDIWSGIISARVFGTHVVHVRTGMSVSQISYGDGVPGSYTEVTF